MSQTPELPDAEEAIKLARHYVQAHTFRKRDSEHAKNNRREISEKIRLGGMRKILAALEAALTRHEGA